jgi:hypothetical protein
MTLVRRLFAKVWVTPLPQGVNMTPLELHRLPKKKKTLPKCLNQDTRTETTAFRHQLEEEWPGRP